MIRLRHENLPAGLSALVRRRSDGDLEVTVSTTLRAGRQRAAVRAGLRAIRPAGRGAGPLPVPAIIMIALAGTWLRAIGRLLRLHLAATTAVAGTVMAAAVVITVAPHVHGPADTGRNPAASPAAPGPATPSASPVARPLPSALPVAARSPAGTTAPPVMTQPSPTASASPQPRSAPTPAAPGSGHGICVELLGIWVCV